MTENAGSFRCALFGEDTLAIQCGEILLAGGHTIVTLVSASPSIRSWAAERAIPVLQPGNGLVDQLAPFEFEYLFSITNLRLLPAEILAQPIRAAINFHDGPLPEYAGLFTPAWALLHRESEYGISFHEMTTGIDAGAILKQRRFAIESDETSLTLNMKCFEAAITAFEELVPELAARSEQRVVQQGPHHHYCGKWDRPSLAGILSFDAPAAELEARVRALDFGPYENPFCAAKLRHGGQTLVARGARVRGDTQAEPGRLVSVDSEGLLIATADGALQIVELETLEGERIDAPAAAALLGLNPGDRIEGIDEATGELLEALASRSAHAEPRLRKRLLHPNPPELSLAQAEAPTSSRDGETLLRQLTLPSNLAERFALGSDSAADSLLLAIAAYFARVSGQTRFQIALFDPAVQSESPVTAKDLVSDWVPWTVAVPEQATLGAVVESARDDLETMRKAGPWLLDLVGRQPILARNPALVRRDTLPIYAAFADDLNSAELGQGATLGIRIAPDGSGVSLVASPGRFDAETFRALGDQIECFLSACVAAPDDTPLDRISTLSPEQRREILEEWNSTARPFPQDRCLHQLIAEQATRTPDATALVFRDAFCSYADLEERANRLANELVALGVGPDQLVGLFLDRSIEMVVSLLAILKAGGAYVPMDPSYPRDRIAWMTEDSGVRVIVTRAGLVDALPPHDAQVLCVDRDADRIADRSKEPPDVECHPDQLAYVIYTSGSTGRPKGVMVEHRNVVSFLTGMDEWIAHETAGVWLAVTSLSFDISVLELIWTLARGFKVVVYSDPVRQDRSRFRVSPRPIDFGLFMWGSDDSQGANKYDLMMHAARFGDERGFSSIWTPERHFHSFGGPFPNPSVTSAAIAAVTNRIAIRAGSCVLPLHNAIRVAEEWAVVDNLSGGRVGIAFAAGWMPNDFVIAPGNFKDAKLNMFREIETVRSLWRGESVEFTNPLGQQVATTTLPRPLQEELPFWVTTAGNPETFRLAGAAGANLLTHLLGQSPEEVAEKIAAYREARREAGFDPATGVVTLMLHTLVAETDDEAKKNAREPMKNYLASSVGLVKDFAWAFPAFKRPGGPDSSPKDIDLGALTEEQLDAMLEFAFERYFETSGLFGSVDTCIRYVEKVKSLDVDEIGCLIDYGVPAEINEKSLELLDQVRIASNAGVAQPVAPEDGTDYSLGAQVERHQVTHLQCTPSMARMLLMDDSTQRALTRLRHLLVGGEALPVDLANELEELVPGRITNMYGPTETTIWSSVEPIQNRPSRVTIGRPIANTQIYVLDGNLEPVPVGTEGELVIGGDGVTRGYHNRPDATAECFVPDPFRKSGRLYRTGDRARFGPDGRIDFLGRLDHQVKIRGYRIELGEIESCLSGHPCIAEAVVVARVEDDGDPRLIAYAVAKGEAPEHELLHDFLAESLPEFMIPAAFVFLKEFPRTPNEKIDRKALPAPEQLVQQTSTTRIAPENEAQATIAKAWQEGLRLESVGIDDNFFDLGGHSLLVIQIHRSLEKTLDIDVTLTDLYRFPTIRSLVEHLERDPAAPEVGSAAGRDRAAKRRSAAGRRRRKK